VSGLWSRDEAERATGGRSARDWEAGGVSIDSRTLEPGDLFVALSDRRDGHDFVAAALEKGAAAALVSRRPAGVGPKAPLLMVDDVLAALEALGRAARARSRAQVVAVTGSAGKTSSKEMLRAALAGQGRVHAAEASFNNHWGVPLSLARMPREADFAVLEIGMNAPGEIAPLARLARPHVALITTVAEAHLAAFDDLAAIAREKAAIFEGLVPGGAAVFPADLEVSPILAAAAARRGARSLRFGSVPEADLRLLEVRLAGTATVVRASRRGAPLLFRLDAPGRHFAANALGVLGAVEALGADVALAALALAGWRPPAGRGTRARVALDPVEEDLALELIDDSYNANPASLEAALEVLAAAAPPAGTGRRVAILGDMLELGPQEEALHREIAALAAMRAVDLVHCAGPRMRALHEALPVGRRGLWRESAAALAAEAHRLVAAGDVVLIKGSKASGIAQVVDAIRKLGHPRAAHSQGTA